MTSIYALVDPRTNEPRYIGKADDPERRFNAHMTCDDGCHKDNWINQLLDEDLEPKLVILARVPDDMWQECEMFMIASLRQFGYSLTNLTDGGDGLRNPSDETRRKISAATTGRKNSASHRRKLSIAMMGNTVALGVKRSEETKRKLSEAHTGKVQSEEARRKNREAHLGSKNHFFGKKHSEESKRKMREAKRRNRLARANIEPTA